MCPICSIYMHYVKLCPTCPIYMHCVKLLLSYMPYIHALRQVIVLRAQYTCTVSSYYCPTCPIYMHCVKLLIIVLHALYTCTASSYYCVLHALYACTVSSYYCPTCPICMHCVKGHGSKEDDVGKPLTCFKRLKICALGIAADNFTKTKCSQHSDSSKFPHRQAKVACTSVMFSF